MKFIHDFDSPGSQPITNFDSSTKEVEGYFSGMVTTMNSSGNYQYEKIQGGFTATLFDLSSISNMPPNVTQHHN